MNADALRAAVVDSDEDRSCAFAGGHGGGQVGSPHLVWSLGGDRPVVCLRAPWLAGALRRLQAVLAHHTAYALLRGADVLRPQLGPHLAVAFPVKGGRLQQLANLLS